MFNKLIRRALQKEIDARLADIPKVSPPQGYNSLEAIRGGMYHWCLVPVGESKVWMELRTSNATQLESCGVVSLVEQLKTSKDASQEDIIDMRNKMEAICKITMNNPSFDSFIKLVTDSDIVISNIRLELERLKSIDLSGMSAKEKDVITKSIYNLELRVAFLLPENTMDFITRWALGVDVTDVKKVSEEKLLEAAILAKNGNDNPHDHISGTFTDRDYSDLDKSAWVVYQKFMDNKKLEKGLRR